MAYDIENTKNAFLNSLLLGSRSECSKIISEQNSKQLPFKVLYEDVIKSALYEVGELWEFNKISVATEHLASAIVEAILNENYPNIVAEEKSTKKVLLSCVKNEYHQIGIKMVSDVFESNSWNAFFLGANTPINELLSFVREVNPDILSISLSMYFNLPSLELLIKKVRLQFPDLPILIGGQAFRKGQYVTDKYANVVYISNLENLDSFINKIQ